MFLFGFVIHTIPGVMVSLLIKLVKSFKNFELFPLFAFAILLSTDSLITCLRLNLLFHSI